MRIAFLCKRHYTGKDVIADRFGRLHEIPFQLASRGHDVTCLCVDYRGKSDACEDESVMSGRLRWSSRSFGGIRLARLLAYPKHLLETLGSLKPDVVVAASDMPCIVLGHWAARRIGVPFAADLYDDFTSFGQARMPGLQRLFGAAVSRADLVVAVSDRLRAVVTEAWSPVGVVVVVPNGVDQSCFFPVDKAIARSMFGLPSEARLFGTAGGLYEEKGVGVLYEAWERIKAADPHAHLVLAGPFRSSLPPPDDVRVHHVGNLGHADVGLLFNAMDVAVVTMRDNAFGRSCFPQKAYEIIACGRPVVAADVGVMKDLLREHPALLHAPESSEELARCVLRQFERAVVPAVPLHRWDEMGATYVELLEGLVGTPAIPAAS